MVNREDLVKLDWSFRGIPFANIPRNDEDTKTMNWSFTAVPFYGAAWFTPPVSSNISKSINMYMIMSVK